MMSRPPPRKPLFQAPTSKNGTSNVPSMGDPVPGQPGWLQIIAKNMLDSDTKRMHCCSPDSTVTVEGPKRGEKGWLVEMANNLVKNQSDSQTLFISQSQPSTRSIEVEKAVISASQPDPVRFDRDIPTLQRSASAANNDMTIDTNSLMQSTQMSCNSQASSDCSQTPSSFDILGSLEDTSNVLQNSQKEILKQSVVEEKVDSTILGAKPYVDESVKDNLLIDSIIQKVIANVNKSNPIGNNTDKIKNIEDKQEKDENKVENSCMEKSFSLLDSAIDIIDHRVKYNIEKTSVPNAVKKNIPESKIINDINSIKNPPNAIIDQKLEHNIANTAKAISNAFMKNNAESATVDKIETNSASDKKSIKDITHDKLATTKNNPEFGVVDEINSNKKSDISKDLIDIRSEVTIESEEEHNVFSKQKQNIPMLLSKEDHVIRKNKPTQSKIKKSINIAIGHKKLPKTKIGKSLKHSKKSIYELTPITNNHQRKDLKTNFGKTTRQKLEELQRLRTAGTWVMCSENTCGKWRYLNEKDPSEIPENWTCSFNSESSYQNCADPEEKPTYTPQNAWVENRFTVGSLVWAKVAGWPWWPAIVDDDPDTGSFFWTGAKGDTWEMSPSWYHVAFFDSEVHSVTRAWAPSRMVIKFGGKTPGGLSGGYSIRLKAATAEASKAAQIEIIQRRKQFCFSARYKGVWGQPWPDFNTKNTGEHFEELDNDMMPAAEEAISQMEDIVLNQSNSSELFSESLIADSFNISLEKMKQNIKKKRKRPNNILQKELYRELPDNCKMRKGLGNVVDQKQIVNRQDEKQKLSDLYSDKSLYTQELSKKIVGSSDNNRIIAENSTNTSLITNSERCNNISVIQNVDLLDNCEGTIHNFSVNLDNGVDSLNESVYRNIVAAINIMDTHGHDQAMGSVAETTLTSTPAKKFTTLTPIKLVKSSCNVISSPKVTESVSKFPISQSPITPINKVKLTTKSNCYSPGIDGRGDSPFVSQIRLGNKEEDVLIKRVKTPIKLNITDTNRKNAVLICDPNNAATSIMDNTAESDAFSMDDSF